MNANVLGFQEIDKTKLMLVGGKGANLGELSRINGIMVPAGFCVTTEAYKKITGNNPELNGLLDELAHLGVEDREKIAEVSQKVRALIEGISHFKGHQRRDRRASLKAWRKGSLCCTVQRHGGGSADWPPLPASRIPI